MKRFSSHSFKHKLWMIEKLPAIGAIHFYIHSDLEHFFFLSLCMLATNALIYPKRLNSSLILLFIQTKSFIQIYSF